MITRIEALVDALAVLNGFHDPSSEAYQLRNPLMLLAYNPKHERNENGRRKFKNFASGYDNGITDTKIKCAGRSRSNLTPFSPLVELVMIHGHQAAAARTVKNFIRRALKDDYVTENTPLSWFTENEPKETI